MSGTERDLAVAVARATGARTSPALSSRRSRMDSGVRASNASATSATSGYSADSSSGSLNGIIIGDMIGEGSFARVFRAVDASTGSILAVKQIETGAADTAAIEKEVGILTKLSHPNLVRYLGAQRVGDKLNICLEYCNGGSLAQMLRQFKSFPERLVRLYTRQMVEALVYLHSKGIVHRDIKGGNVLVDGHEARGVAKLSDFGCSAYYFEGEAQPGSKRLDGTVLWMAPEVARQSGQISPASDIWSLGATVIEMATGQPPWREEGLDDPVPALFKIATTKVPPAFPSSLSAEGKSFLDKCLRVEPSERYTAKQLSLHAFLSLEGPSEHAAPKTAAVGVASPVVGALGGGTIGFGSLATGAPGAGGTNRLHSLVAAEPRTPGPPGFALDAAARGRDRWEERDAVYLASCRLAITRVMHLLANVRTGSEPDVVYRDMLAKEVELRVPAVGPCPAGNGIRGSIPLTSEKARVSGRDAVLGLARRGDALVEFTSVTCTKELIDIPSHTAMWKWEVNVSLSSVAGTRAGESLGVASGTASVTFAPHSRSAVVVREIEVVWDASALCAKVAGALSV